MNRDVLSLLDRHGPLTGLELLDGLQMDHLSLWRHCMSSPELITQSIARLYMRLDRRIGGYARLSPSILREFLTYTVVARSGMEPDLARRTRALSEHIRAVTREKSLLAYQIVSALVSGADNPDLILEHACFILAGDIVYDMAHDVPRPERSTGRRVHGSDLDLVVVLDDGFPEDHRERLDERIFSEKHRMLLAPQLREEIDYVVKDLGRVREQLRFDTFRRMVACKILQEGAFLFGNEVLFTSIKARLAAGGVIARLRDMEAEARRFRAHGRKTLLATDLETVRRDHLDLFYPTEESEEFE